jgi:acyl-[acyl-carrier-protein] desaturase
MERGWKGSALTALAAGVVGSGIPGFIRKAAQIAKAGIYDLKVHRDEVLMPVLRHWKIFEMGGLDAAAEDARRRLSEYLEKLDASIARFEDRLATSTIPRIAAAK